MRAPVTEPACPKNLATSPAGTAQSITLALRPKEAAAALGIGETLLWSMTNRNAVPHVRIGRAVLYPIADLEQWLSEGVKQKKGGRK